MGSVMLTGSCQIRQRVHFGAQYKMVAARRMSTHWLVTHVHLPTRRLPDPQATPYVFTAYARRCETEQGFRNLPKRFSDTVGFEKDRASERNSQ